MSKYLFLFTISPVQSYIEQARKTQDLYAGSQILSDLIDYAMSVAKKESTSDVYEEIFPSSDVSSKPNRFIIITSPKEDVQSFGNKIKIETQKYFIDELGKKVKKLQEDSIHQLNDFLKIYWVAIKYEESQNFTSQISALERKLGAVKNVRYFEQLAEKGRKCSMDGVYNVKFYRKTKRETEKNINVLGDRKKLFHSDAKVIDDRVVKELTLGELRAGEGLSAISMMKRFYKSENEFLSTANIALLKTLKDIAQKNENTLNEYSLCIGEKSKWQEVRNGQLFFSENLNDKYFEKEDFPKAGLKVAREKMEEIQKIAKQNGFVFSKYYAIIAFDVDGMGKKLQACQSKDEYKKLSGLLGEFADEAKKLIDDNDWGRTVYAGGDDYLGFINLNHLFDGLHQLRALLDEKVNKDLPDHLKLTFSAGIAIAHYKTPLSEVLSWARKMEKKAKSIKQKGQGEKKKDAFSIAVLKHSGEIHDTTWRWNYGQELWTTDLIKEITSHLRNRNISNKFISNLSQTFTSLLERENGSWGKIAKEDVFEDVLDSILKCELKRFIKRAKAESSNINVGLLSKNLYQLYDDHQDFDLALQNFLNLLHICDFISRHINKTVKIKEEAIS